MSGFILSPAARADIDGIWDYTVEPRGADQAAHYLRMIRTACEELARGKRLGRPAEDVRPGYHRAQVGSHILFFRRLDTGVIDVIRILHQRMTFAGIFKRLFRHAAGMKGQGAGRNAPRRH